MTEPAEIVVRMGELAVSTVAGQVLVSIGLGSCIGLAMLDRARGVAGLAHVMLPAGGVAPEPLAKFADAAVPALAAGVEAAGARHVRLQAVLVGGAQMFSHGPNSMLDIGRRNEEAVCSALRQLRIPVVAAATRGSSGRTIRVCTDGRVTVKAAGGDEVALLMGGAA